MLRRARQSMTNEFNRICWSWYICCSTLLFVVGCDSKPSRPLAGSNKEGAVKESQRWPLLDAERGHLKAYTRLNERNTEDLHFENAPSFLHALKMAPQFREPELNRRTWLVLTYAIWNVKDTRSILAAVKSVERVGNEVQLGVRPYDKYEEIDVWYPKKRDDLSSPLWLLLEDGKVLATEAGVLSEEEIVDFLKANLPNYRRR